MLKKIKLIGVICLSITTLSGCGDIIWEQNGFSGNGTASHAHKKPFAGGGTSSHKTHSSARTHRGFGGGETSSDEEASP